jgi:hypothetical protein
MYSIGAYPDCAEEVASTDAATSAVVAWKSPQGRV